MGWIGCKKLRSWELTEPENVALDSTCRLMSYLSIQRAASRTTGSLESLRG